MRTASRARSSSRCTIPSARPPTACRTTACSAWAAACGGGFVPLARLDLNEDPIGEARRAASRAARAASSCTRARRRFTVDDRPPRAGLRARRGAPPAGADPRRPRHAADRRARSRRSPSATPGAILILAHAAIVDQDRICWLVAGRRNVFFDTSTWGVADVLSLLARVAPEQVLWATDLPYGNYTSSLALVASLLEELDAPEPVRALRGRRGPRGHHPAASCPSSDRPLAPATWEISHAAAARLRVHRRADAAPLGRPRRPHRPRRPRARRLRRPPRGARRRRGADPRA